MPVRSFFRDDCSSVSGWNNSSATTGAYITSVGGSIYMLPASFVAKPTYSSAVERYIYTKKAVALADPDGDFDIYFDVSLADNVEKLHQAFSMSLYFGSGTSHAISIVYRSDKLDGFAFGLLFQGGTYYHVGGGIWHIKKEGTTATLYVNETLIKAIDVSSLDNLSLNYVEIGFDTANNNSYPLTVSSWHKFNDIRIDQAYTPVTSVSLSEHDVNLIKYQSQNLDVTIEPADGYIQSTETVSSNPSAVTGLVYGLDVGESDVTFSVTTIDENGDTVILSDACHVTVLTNLLPSPDKPTWSDSVLSWNAIEYAIGYTINLYVASDQYTGQYGSVSAETNSYDLTSELQSIYTSGLTNLTITATVHADGDSNPYYDSEESELSSVFIPTALLQVAQPVWTNKIVTWKDVANAESYTVRLYNASAECLDTQTVAKGIQRYDYTDLIENYLPAGSYTATVQAKPEGVS